MTMAMSANQTPNQEQYVEFDDEGHVRVKESKHRDRRRCVQRGQQIRVEAIGSASLYCGVRTHSLTATIPTSSLSATI